MSFRVHSKDLLARTGTIQTKSGAFQTPHMFAVVDPNRPDITRQILREVKSEAIMTNAYLLKRGQQESVPVELHDHLGFKATIATDSGAYQILQFGEVSIEPTEIVRYQEEINSDIAVILDVPTGFRANLQRARWTVDETIRRADESLAVMKRDDTLWVGPVQGGVHLAEVDRSAREMAKRDFDIYALGSPTELMETQHFETLVDMVVTAKKALPISKPLHLFGAGHPAIFPFFIALGCDLFDSAAYALYAKLDKYFTPEGTLQLGEVEELACECISCRSVTPDQLRALPAEEREVALAKHNLSICMTELRRIREAIRTGRLWELLEARARAHPALRRCFHRLGYHTGFVAQYNPAVKLHGIYYYGESSRLRPEIVQYSVRLLAAVEGQTRERLVLLPAGWRRPFHQDPGLESTVRELRDLDHVSVLFYSLPYGPVPLELDEAYPIPHTDIFDQKSSDDYEISATLVADYVRRTKPKTVLLLAGEARFGMTVRTHLSAITSIELIHVQTLTEVSMIAKEESD